MNWGGGRAQFKPYLEATNPAAGIIQVLQWETFRDVFQVRARENNRSMPSLLLQPYTFKSCHLFPGRIAAELHNPVANGCMGLLQLGEGWTNPKVWGQTGTLRLGCL